MNIFEHANSELNLPTDKYINGSCSIAKGVITKDANIIYDSDCYDISESLFSIYQHFELAYPKFYKMDNLSKLGWLTAEILLKNSFEKKDYQPERVGLILANANSSLDVDLRYIESANDIASPSLFVYTLPNIVIGEISIRNGFKGEHAFFVQESFDSDFIARQVNYLLDNDILQACICGWVDVLRQDYKSTLFLVEKNKKESSVLFSAENMRHIFDNN